jgi:hypothetical protein
MKFESEAALVEMFALALATDASPWGAVEVGFEFNYSSGRTDVVAVAAGERLIAFEAKLNKWRVALDQAFRSTFFASATYVLLPERAAELAEKFVEEFRRRGVGLCTLTANGIQIRLPAGTRENLQPWLTARAITQIRDAG